MSDPIDRDEYNKEFVRLSKEFVRIYSKILGELTDEELDAEIKRLARKLGLEDKKWS